jgi:multiple sugar transport system permease protein
MTDFWQRRNFKEAGSAYLFMLPAIIVMGTFLILPLGYAIFLAFHRVKILGEISYQFIGFQNFLRLASDERGWIALKNTIEYVAIVVPIQTSLALILAVMLNSQIRGKNWFRIILFLPTVTSSAVLTLIFMWIYNSNGLLNNLLHAIGLPTFNWIGDPAVALKAIMLMNIWSTAPFFMTIYLAAMQDIPTHLYEAATIDGANKFEQFVFITLPWLKPVTFFVLVMGIIGTFQLFDQSYIFSAGSGGPNNSTLTIVLLIYQYVFESLDLGYAAAIAMILAIVIILFTSIQRRFFQDDRLD